jgi:DNA-binding transcriptional MerR regulator
MKWNHFNKGRNPKPYSISALASEFDISTRTLRYYEEKGLLSPRRTCGNQRIYSKRDRARLKLILRGRRFGFTLDEVAEMIGMSEVNMDEVEQIEKTLEHGNKKLAEIRSRIQEFRLLEKEMLDVKERLLNRLAELRTGGSLKNSTNGVDSPIRKGIEDECSGPEGTEGTPKQMLDDS